MRGKHILKELSSLCLRFQIKGASAPPTQRSEPRSYGTPLAARNRYL